MARLTDGRLQPYVPFFLKLPFQHSGVEYTAEFNNVLSGDLALKILQGKLETQTDVVSLLDAQGQASLH